MADINYIKKRTNRIINEVAHNKFNGDFSKTWSNFYKFVKFKTNIDTYTRKQKGLNKFTDDELIKITCLSWEWRNIWMNNDNDIKFKNAKTGDIVVGLFPNMIIQIDKKYYLMKLNIGAVITDGYDNIYELLKDYYGYTDCNIISNKDYISNLK